MSTRSLFDKADNALLIIVGVVAAVVALKVFGALFGFVWFLAKIALVTAVVAGVWRAVGGSRRELGSRRHRELR
jgi:type IV secretory pathway TrbD component